MESFKILALSGGGSKGYLHIGALEILEEKVGNLHEYFKEGIYGCSIGSIIGTAIAFGIPLKKIKELFKSLSFNELFKIDMKVEEIFIKKGIFNMDLLEKKLIELFNLVNIQIENKVLGDALIPLKIQASNITKGIPVIFQKNVPVIKALLCSSCIPIVFQPQQINNSLYVDGGFLTNVLLSVIPENEREKTLCLTIIHSDPTIKPTNIKNMSLSDFFYKLYKISCLYERQKNPIKNNIDLYYDKGSGLTTWTDIQKDEMVLHGRTLTTNFFSESSF